MYEALKQSVWQANLLLAKHRLVTLTWGNVSGADRAQGVFAIKPSGIAYEALKSEDMVVVDIASGQTVQGALRPSSDTPTHAELYRQFAWAGGIVHTHSHAATAWAQAGREIPPYGTTHADTFAGVIPCIDALEQPQVDTDYELNTGRAIAAWFAQNGLDAQAIPGCLQAFHGAFAWGRDGLQAVEHAIILEEVAALAADTERIAGLAPAKVLPAYILHKHYQRKHGQDAYYGQR